MSSAAAPARSTGFRVDVAGHRVMVSRAGQFCGSAELQQLDAGIARVRLMVTAGQLPSGARSALVDAMFELPELQRCRLIQASMPLGDVELLDGLRKRCPRLHARAAGSTCLIDAPLTQPKARSRR